VRCKLGNCKLKYPMHCLMCTTVRSKCIYLHTRVEVHRPYSGCTQKASGKDGMCEAKPSDVTSDHTSPVCPGLRVWMRQTETQTRGDMKRDTQREEDSVTDGAGAHKAADDATPRRLNTKSTSRKTIQHSSSSSSSGGGNGVIRQRTGIQHLTASARPCLPACLAAISNAGRELCGRGK